mmetsp:Transcript_46351/g.83826  ORF Transcript_46351/g.83826 Transcript_46351/m.83826 type:complete len:200 (-) Transcript_46351:1436-2035(-)
MSISCQPSSTPRLKFSAGCPAGRCATTTRRCTPASRVASSDEEFCASPSGFMSTSLRTTPAIICAGTARRTGTKQSSQGTPSGSRSAAAISPLSSKITPDAAFLKVFNTMPTSTPSADALPDSSTLATRISPSPSWLHEKPNGFCSNLASTSASRNGGEKRKTKLSNGFHECQFGLMIKLSGRRDSIQPSPSPALAARP